MTPLSEIRRWRVKGEGTMRIKLPRGARLLFVTSAPPEYDDHFVNLHYVHPPDGDDLAVEWVERRVLVTSDDQAPVEESWDYIGNVRLADGRTRHVLEVR